jgi:NADH:ubiquinone oxidoreductase subunit E
MLTVHPSPTAEQRHLIETIDGLVETHGRDRAALIPILQDVRDRYHEISDLAMQVVADRLGIPPVDVYGVVTFYSFLGPRRTGRYVVRLCRTLSCHLARTRAVADGLERELGIHFGQTTADGRFTLEWTNCIGMCDQAPAMLVDDRVHGGLTPEKASGILAAIREAEARDAAIREAEAR